jgi:hypothetical protein
MMGQMSEGTITAPSQESAIPVSHLSTSPISKRDYTQFGEKYTTVRDFMKRYWNCGSLLSLRQQLEVSGATWVPEINNVNYAELTHVIPIATTLCYGTSAWYGSMYRFWRGSMRYKIIVQNNQQATTPVITDLTAISTTAFQTPRTVVGFTAGNGWIPSNYDSPAFQASEYNSYYLTGAVADMFGLGASWVGSLTMQKPSIISVRGYDTSPDGATQSVWTYPFGSGGTVAGLGSGFPRSVAGNIPFDFDSAYAPVHEIEVPFATEYNCLYTPFDPPATDFTDQSVYNTGVILVARLGLPRILDATATPQGGIMQDSIHLLASIGDDFHYGICLGPHLVQYVSLKGQGFFAAQNNCMPSDSYNPIPP